jgi:alpha-L-fucosidase
MIFDYASVRRNLLADTLSAIYSFKFFLFLLSIIVFSSAFVRGQSKTNQRAQWFVDSRFGMFIHWGVYSGAEGIWKGEKLRYDNDYAEWIQYRNRIDKGEYLSLLDRFDWNQIDPEEWVILAKQSGMKYVTITAKHHDGFAIWDSKVGDYDLGDYTSPKRDIIKELADACKKHDLKLGLYYSHWVDWEHQYGWDHTREVYELDPEKYDIYWQEKVIPQMRELLTNYGSIGLIWFDMWKHHSTTIVTKEQLLQLKSLIRELQPDCLVNSRLGLSVQEDPDVDFQTLGDNQFGNRKLDHPWQSPATVAHSWGFHALDSEWKSTKKLLRYLVSNVGLNGNMMLNIGPRGNGEVPYEISQRMIEMGEWLEVNGESIYGSGAFDLRSDLHDWGLITYRETEGGQHRIYLHVMNWPLDRHIKVTGISDAPKRVFVLKDKQQSELSFEHVEVETSIQLPYLAPDPFISVVVLEYDQKPGIVDGLVAESNPMGYSFNSRNWSESAGNEMVEKKSRFGSVPEHIVVNKPSRYKWKIYENEPGSKVFDVSYSYQGESSSSKIVITVDGRELSHEVQPTGKTVGEPKQDWVIDNFASNRVGVIDIKKVGYYEIELEVLPAKGEEVKFQWLWLQAE